MALPTPFDRRGTWWAWVLASTLGWAVGLTAGGGVAGTHMAEPDPSCPLCGEWNWLAALIGGFLGLLLSGVAVGIGQWLVLRPHIPRAGWWILATLGGWAISDFAGVIIWASTLSWKGFMAVGLCFATIVGISQTLALGRAISFRAVWWIPANIGGWFAGWIAGRVTLSVLVPLLATIGKVAIRVLVAGSVFGIAVGAVYSMLTGIVLIGLLEGIPRPSP